MRLITTMMLVVILISIHQGNAFADQCTDDDFDINNEYPICHLTGEQQKELVTYLEERLSKKTSDGMEVQQRYRYAHLLLKYVYANKDAMGVMSSDDKLTDNLVQKTYRDLESLRWEKCDSTIEKSKLRQEVRKDLKTAFKSDYKDQIKLFKKVLNKCKDSLAVFGLLDAYYKTENYKEYTKLFVGILKEDQEGFNYYYAKGRPNNSFLVNYDRFLLSFVTPGFTDHLSNKDVRDVADAILRKYQHLHDPPLGDENLMISHTAQLMNLVLLAHNKGLDDVVMSISPMLCQYDYTRHIRTNFYKDIGYLCSD